MRASSSIACAGVFALCSCTQPMAAPPPNFAQTSGPACFRANEVFGYSQEPDGSVDVQTASGPFRLQLDASCPNFAWIMQIGVRPVEDPWLCAGRPDDIITAYQTQFSQCAIRQIEPLSAPIS